MYIAAAAEESKRLQNDMNMREKLLDERESQIENAAREAESVKQEATRQIAEVRSGQVQVASEIEALAESRTILEREVGEVTSAKANLNEQLSQEMSRLQQIESSLKAKENELAAKEEDIKSSETKLALDLQMYTKDLRALEKERESWEKKHAQESVRLLKRSARNNCGLLKRKTHQRYPRPASHSRKRDAKRFQEMEEKSQDARKKRNLEDEAKRETMRNEAEALREERTAASDAKLEAHRERERLEAEVIRFEREKDYGKKSKNPESVESALRQRERDVEGMSVKALHLRKPWWCERNCVKIRKISANSQQDLFARLKEETASVAEQRKALREEQEAAMNREREEKIKNGRRITIRYDGSKYAKTLGIY